MRKRIRTGQSAAKESTSIEVTSQIGSIHIEIRSRDRSQFRRSIALALFREIKPFLKYFRSAQLKHYDDGSSSFKRSEERGLIIPTSSSMGATGILGFEIRMARLKNGWSQSELAQRADICSRNLSRIERGLCHPHRFTLVRLEAALNTTLAHRLPNQRKAEKVEIAQGAAIRREESSTSF